MKAKDIMSTPVVETKGNDTLANTKSLFTRNKISSAVIMKENGEIEGIISSTDLAAIHNENLMVRQVMSKRIHVCALNARVKDVARTMINEEFHHIIVMEDGKVSGMISSLDVIKGLLSEMDQCKQV